MREAPVECLKKDPALVIYKRKPTADFSDVKYDIAHFARGAEEAPRPAEHVFEDPLAASMTRVQVEKLLHLHSWMNAFQIIKVHKSFIKASEPRKVLGISWMVSTIIGL